MAVQSVTFALLPLIASRLGNHQYSLWSIAYGYVQLAVPYLVLQLDGSFTRFMAGETDNKTLSSHFSSLLLVVLTTGAIFLVLSRYFATQIDYLLFKQTENGALIFTISLWAVTRSVLLFVRNYFRTRAKFEFDVTISAFQQFALIAGVICAAFVTATITTLFYVALAVDALLIIFCLRRIAKDLGGLPRPSWIPRKHLHYALPLIPVATLSWIVDYSDQLFVVHLLGHELNARYAIYYLYARLPHWMVITPWHYAFFPFISRFEYVGDGIEKVHYYIREALGSAFCVITVLLVAIVLFGGEIIELIGHQPVASDSIALLTTIGMCAYFSAFYQISYHLISLQNKTYLVFAIFLGGALLNTLGNIFLIPQIGLLGAALSTLFSFLMIGWLTMRFCGISVGEVLQFRSLCKLVVILALAATLKAQFGLGVISVSLGLFVLSLVAVVLVVREDHPTYLGRIATTARRIRGLTFRQIGA